MTKTSRASTLGKTITDALLARDRLEVRAMERLLAATRLERPRKRIRKRRPARGRLN